MEQIVMYIVVYLLIGVAVAVAMAAVPIQEPGGGNQFGQGSKRHMVDAYCFIGLAWPVSVAAFVYGSLAHLLDRTYRSSENS